MKNLSNKRIAITPAAIATRDIANTIETRAISAMVLLPQYASNIATKQNPTVIKIYALVASFDLRLRCRKTERALPRFRGNKRRCIGKLDATRLHHWYE